MASEVLGWVVGIIQRWMLCGKEERDGWKGCQQHCVVSTAGFHGPVTSLISGPGLIFQLDLGFVFQSRVKAPRDKSVCLKWPVVPAWYQQESHELHHQIQGKREANG